MVCIRCQKRPAIIFIQRMDNGQMKQDQNHPLYCNYPPVSSEIRGQKIRTA